MKNSFEPIYLQDAKRHIEWLYKKLSESEKKSPDNYQKNISKSSVFSKIVDFLKAIF